MSKQPGNPQGNEPDAQRDLAGLLGGLLGGQLPQGSADFSSGGQDAPSGFTQDNEVANVLGGLGSLLGSVLGGGGSSGGGSVGSLLGGVIGSDQASTAISQQTDLAPSLVQALLPMIIRMLAREGQRSNMRSQGIDVDGDGILDNGEQLALVAQRLQAGEPVNEQELRSSGFTQALAQHSGYSEAEVAPATVKILQALAEQNR